MLTTTLVSLVLLAMLMLCIVGDVAVVDVCNGAGCGGVVVDDGYVGGVDDVVCGGSGVVVVVADGVAGDVGIGDGIVVVVIVGGGGCVICGVYVVAGSVVRGGVGVVVVGGVAGIRSVDIVGAAL